MAELILIENDIKSFQKPMEAEMENPLRHFERELIKIRTGRAHTSMIEDIPELAVGDAVVHPEFGIGVLSKLYEGTVGLTYKVVFSKDGRERTIVARLAKLKKL